jgi:hypothetical protein
VRTGCSDRASKTDAKSQSWVLQMHRRKPALQSPGVTVERLNRSEDRKSGGTGIESSQETRDGRHEAGVRQMKNESSRDDSELREKQVCWQKTSCDVERRSGLALVRPGSMHWRNLRHESSEPSDRERAARGVTRGDQRHGPTAGPRGPGVKRAALDGRSA